MRPNLVAKLQAKIWPARLNHATPCIRVSRTVATYPDVYLGPVVLVPLNIFYLQCKYKYLLHTEKINGTLKQIVDF